MDPSKPDSMQEAKLHFLDYLRILRIRKAIIITVFLITFTIATVVTFILPESYSSTARIKIEPDTIADIQGVSGGPGDATYAPYDPYFIQTAFEIIQDQVVLSKVIAKLDLNTEWGKRYNGGVPFQTPITMKMLERRLALDPVRNTKLIEITVFDEDKNMAANIANAIVEAYRDYRQNLRTEQTQRGIKALEDQYQEDEAKIDAAQQKVDQLRSDLHVNDYDPNSVSPSPTLTAEELRVINNQMIEGEAAYMKLEKEVTELQPLSPEKLRDVLPTLIPDSTLSDLLVKLNTAKQNFVSLTNDYSLANPDVIRIQSLIDELNNEINDRVSGILAGLNSQVQSQKAALDTLTASVNEAKQKDLDDAARTQPYWEEKRKLENMLDFHQLLSRKIEAEKIDMQIPRTAMVEIVRRAEPGKDPVRPNKTLNIILGVVVGLIVGVGLAFFIEYLDTSVKTIDEVERAFQAPVLGVIPQNVGYLLDEGPDSQHAEAYRVLRTHFLFSRKDDKLNSIVIISAGMGEGKSTTALNLATVFAQAGQRVVIVDSDLRRPTLHKILHVSNNVGLTNYLLKQNSLEEVIQTTPVPMLDFMASGKLPSSSMSILNSLQMKNLIAELKQRYDFVFFDSPPILGVSDAAVLASEVDMAIQVIQYRRYPQPMNIRAKQLIEKAGGNLVGIVLNNITMSQDEGYYYYYSRNEDEVEATPQSPPDDPNKIGIKQKY
ncbi:MAG TPA: polysaccharide biosynthesis tyrosine autokinase [Candidatus Limnocylindrales bacterium]|nr:polysaccharide biosynthesis tyrosine autokinase [Candidatus Limnocylindrales bacterium]